MSLIGWKSQLANQAIVEVGHNPIDNVLSNTRTDIGRLINLFLDDVIELVLTEYKFEILNKSITLSSLQNTNSNTSYKIPADLLRFVGISTNLVDDYLEFINPSLIINKSVNWNILNGEFTFTAVPDNYVTLIYTSLDEARITPQMKEAIVLKLASKLASKLGGGSEIQKSAIYRASRLAMEKAKMESIQDHEQPIQAPPKPYCFRKHNRI